MTSINETKTNTDLNNQTNNNNNTDNSTGINNPTDTTTNDKYVYGNLEVSDKNLIWQSTNRLRIFENPLYDNDEVIAPLSSNSYVFYINNKTKYSINYKLTFNEINEHMINMKYRLKKNDKYLVGSSSNWVSYDMLNIQITNLNSKEKDKYILDWKWFDGNNDSEIGAVDSRYTLNVLINAESN